MLSFLNKADPLAKIHEESRNSWNETYPKDQTLSRAQTAEFALKKFQAEKNLSQDLWRHATQPKSSMKKLESFIGWSSLKIGQFLTFAPSQRTLEQNCAFTTLALLNKKLPDSSINSFISKTSVPTEEVSRIYQEAFKDKLGSTIQDTMINSTTSSSSIATRQEDSITKSVKRLAVDSAQKTHDFQKAVGFYVPAAIVVIALAAKLAPLTLSNRSN